VDALSRLLNQNDSQAVLVLADGTVFSGYSIGVSSSVVGEVVFNTAMTGYQEILTDPSYHHQLVTMTYPHIGNVGINLSDMESAGVGASGMIVREGTMIASNWRSNQSLRDYCNAQNVVLLAGVDTRRLTRYLRDHGAQKGCILPGNDIEQAQAQAQAFPGLEGSDCASIVSCDKAYEWVQPTDTLCAHPQVPSLDYHVVVYDFGVKQQICRLLVDLGCKVTVVPAKTPVEDVLQLQPDGVFLSNGPGDPAACDYAIENTKQLLDLGLPLFGICLGFQIVALACGAKTQKMKFGHHGANHPVQNCLTKRVMITSQNHSFCVATDTLPAQFLITHVSLFDGTLQGIKHKTKPVMAFQGHPEASPGPQDIYALFAEFVDMIAVRKQKLCQKEPI
jgi:carbamoyl-phosphate synthase small subunit